MISASTASITTAKGKAPRKTSFNVIGAEIGLLTPPLGLSCFVIKSVLADTDITLKDVFLGALPFAVVMLAVLALIIAYPQLSIGILG
jgi:C4-dicarboxylate transporter, DctM subunit